MGKKKKHTLNKNKKSVGRAIKHVLKLLAFLFLLLVVIGIFYFYNTYGKTIIKLQQEAKKIARSSTEETFKSSQTGLVYDINGELISTLKGVKDVYYIEYKDIPPTILNAILVTEDKKFFNHDGVDYLANIRAAIALIKNKGKITQGASTVTQQLARNVFLTHDVTYERKIKEIFIAQELEKIYPKDKILEFYINNIYYSNGYYGILAAANGYFDKGVNQLSLSESVFLCAIPNNPSVYDPFKNMDNTLERRDRILKQMYENEKINLIDYRVALDEEIELIKMKSAKNDYVETFVYHSAIKALMKEEGFVFRNQFSSAEDRESYEASYDELYYNYQKKLYTGGYRIYTSIDLHKQEVLQRSVDEGLEKFRDKNEEGIFELQGAAVSIDNDTGRVVAIVGGRSQEHKGYTLNRGYQSYRQPGSAIKPVIVYAPSFERGYTPDSIVVDERIEGGPRNSGGNYIGEMKLQRAIELSKNTIAWKLYEEITPLVGMSYLLDMNFSRIVDNDYYPAASLGGFTIGVSPLEMAAAFSTIENDGYYRKPTCIIRITDSEGNQLVGDNITTKQIYQRKAARITTEALTGVMKNGTAKGLGLSNTISAGKTGTTDERRDGWFVGYTPYYTTSVWVGCDIPKTIDDLKGASYPGTIWHTYMEEIHGPGMDKKFETYDWRAELLEKNQEEDKDNPSDEEGTEDIDNLSDEEGIEDIDNPSHEEDTDHIIDIEYMDSYDVEEDNEEDYEEYHEDYYDEDYYDED
ncbi:MAG: glycosyl transferase [Clostridiales bacterium]|nr:glycosyl transferase [Clostridiales bacterium]